MSNRTAKKKAARQRQLQHQARKQAKQAADAGSPRTRHAPSQWAEAPAAKRQLVESFDNFAGLRSVLRDIAGKQNEWAGIPMPLDGQRLVIEPTYPHATALAQMGGDEHQAKPIISGPRRRPVTRPEPTTELKPRNAFWSVSRRAMVHIWQEGNKVDWGLVHGIHHFGMDLQTMGCADAWGIEQESKAVHTLGTLVRHRQFKQYMLTGMFLETSKRSNITYVFRRLRPTIALSMRDSMPKIICVLCLHPIGFYQGSWAGAMTPSDDVLAHLMLMRGDEHMFWRRANQHPAWRPEAGL